MRVTELPYPIYAKRQYVVEKIDGDKKRCSLCHQWLLNTNVFFHKNNIKPDGLSDRCKWCNNRVVREFKRNKKKRAPEVWAEYCAELLSEYSGV